MPTSTYPEFSFEKIVSVGRASENCNCVLPCKGTLIEFILLKLTESFVYNVAMRGDKCSEFKMNSERIFYEDTVLPLPETKIFPNKMLINREVKEPCMI